MIEQVTLKNHLFLFIILQRRFNAVTTLIQNDSLLNVDEQHILQKNVTDSNGLLCEPIRKQGSLVKSPIRCISPRAKVILFIIMCVGIMHQFKQYFLILIPGKRFQHRSKLFTRSPDRMRMCAVCICTV